MTTLSAFSPDQLHLLRWISTNKMEIHSSGVSTTMDGLIEQGYVIRRLGLTQGWFRIQLTEKGWKVVNRMREMNYNSSERSL